MLFALRKEAVVHNASDDGRVGDYYLVIPGLFEVLSNESSLQDPEKKPKKLVRPPADLSLEAFAQLSQVDFSGVLAGMQEECFLQGIRGPIAELIAAGALLVWVKKEVAGRDEVGLLELLLLCGEHGKASEATKMVVEALARSVGRMPILLLGGCGE